MRVIAGSAKGRKLKAPKGLDTRPMTGRAREALFSSLGGEVRGEVLDLFAGSGSLGIEAVSRGIATSAVFVERAAKAVRALEANLEACGTDGVTVRDDVRSAVAGLTGRTFGLVFVDPPFDIDEGEVGALLDDLMPLLSAGATVVVHRRTGDADLALPPGLGLVSERKYGDSTLWRYERS